MSAGRLRDLTNGKPGGAIVRLCNSVVLPALIIDTQTLERSVLLDCIQLYLRLATLSRKMPAARVGAKCGER